MTLREATHAFLLKDYAVSVRHASDVMATVSPAEVPWFDRLDQQPDEATDEHRRKTLLLLITLSASIWSSESPALSKATQLSPAMASQPRSSAAFSSPCSSSSCCSGGRATGCGGRRSCRGRRLCRRLR
jgi:hypothetical protein